MDGTIRDRYEAFPDPSPELVPIGPAQLDRIDDAFHYGWSWHRYRFAFVPTEGRRILDAGCGTGLSTLALAKINPGATVVGVDFSERSLELAEERRQASGLDGVSFLRHDLTTPLPEDLGKFDFVVARGILGNGDDPTAILATLAAALAPSGLLEADFPSAAGRMPIRQLVRALDAVVRPEALTAERAEVGVELLRSLRPDHPIRRFDAARYGPNPPSLARFVAAYLNDRGLDWTLEHALASLETAGLPSLYVADRGGWRPDRVFGPDISQRLRDRVSALEEPALARLKDALDITIHPDSYLIYARRAAFEPHLPDWPERKDFESMQSLVPLRSGLAEPTEFVHDSAGSRDAVSYRSINGAIGELHVESDAIFRLVDGRKTIGEIETTLARTESPEARRGRWMELAGLGFLLLKSPDPRQHIDCAHLGSIRDRLDCGCPRRWLRGCEKHGFCTLSTAGIDDPQFAVLQEAVRRSGIEAAPACDRCPDYSPDV